jgi:hypothetical protein
MLCIARASIACIRKRRANTLGQIGDAEETGVQNALLICAIRPGWHQASLARFSQHLRLSDTRPNVIIMRRHKEMLTHQGAHFVKQSTTLCLDELRASTSRSRTLLEEKETIDNYDDKCIQSLYSNRTEESGDEKREIGGNGWRRFHPFRIVQQDGRKHGVGAV